jgi:hypothetical protein
MKKVTGGSGGGGYGSAQHVSVGNRLGQPARGKRPRHVAGYGQMHGDHVTDGSGGGRVRGDPTIPRFTNSPVNAGQQLGNAWAANVPCGVGGGATVMKSGSQQAGRVNPIPTGRDTLSEFGPDYRGRGSR